MRTVKQLRIKSRISKENIDRNSRVSTYIFISFRLATQPYNTTSNKSIKKPAITKI